MSTNTEIRQINPAVIVPKPNCMRLTFDEMKRILKYVRQSDNKKAPHNTGPYILTH
jgi:RNase P protein component